MKINLQKIATFAASIVLMSWSFAGYRAIQQEPNLESWSMFLAALVATALMLAVQGYWIYIEEMKKGTLKRKIGLFDRIHARLTQQSREKHS